MIPRSPGVRGAAGDPGRRDLERALDYFRRALAINPNMEGVRISIELIEKVLVERRRKFI